MNKLSRRDAERRLRVLEAQRDQALRVMRSWVYLTLAAILTLLFQSALWGLIYVALFIGWTVWTARRLRRAAAEPARTP